MSTRRPHRAAWCGILLSFLTFTIGFSGAQARADDQPGVARISVVHGNVDVKRGDSSDTISAAVNAPVMVGDYVTTEKDARAEVQFDNQDVLRVSTDTQLRITKLDQADHSIQLAQGSVELRVFGMNGSNPSVETPSVVVRPDQPGQYVVSVTSDGDTQVTVRSGQADVSDDQGAQKVTPGNTMIARGSSSDASFQSVATVSDADFDRWTDDLDQAVASSSVPSNVPDNVVGAGNLDAYGRWVNDPTYGQVWNPNVGPDWVPYSAGQWVWEPYYGWTWVSYEPWGWAPYHYGNWFYADEYGWCWYPGPAYARPVWRPALVAFFGFGAADIGWVAVGPGEPFYPWWGGNNINIVNVTNIYNITNVYNNFNHRPFVVDRDDFGRGDFHHHRPIPIDPQDMGKVRIVDGGPPIAPTSRNLIAARDGRITPGSTAVSRRFDAFKAPAQIASFQDERSRMQVAADRFNTSADRQPVVRQPDVRQPVTQPVARDTMPVARNNSPFSAGDEQALSSPWERFGSRGPSTVADTPGRTNGGADRAPVDRLPVDRGSVDQAHTSTTDPWSRFGAGQPSQRFGTQPDRVSTDRTVPNRTNPERFAPESQIAPTGWSRFNSAPQSTRPSYYRPSSMPAGDQGAWNRFGSGPGYGSRVPSRPQYGQGNWGRPQFGEPDMSGRPSGRPSGSGGAQPSGGGHPRKPK